MRINMRIVHEHKQLLRLFWEAKLHSAKFCSPVSPNSTTRIRGRVQLLGYEKRRLETNHWTGVTQRTWHKSCGYYGKWTSFLPFRVQLYRMWAKALIGDDGSRFCRKRSERPCGQNTKGLSLCFCELNFTQKNQHTSLKLVCCSFFLSYRTTERAIRATVWRIPRIATDNA